jgi:hypothetical protein
LSTKFFKFLEQKIISFLLVFVNFVFVSNFEVGVKDSEDQTHEKEEAHNHVDDKENAVASPSVVTRKHNIRKVGSGETYQHAPEATTECIEIHCTFHGANIDSLSDPTKQENKNSDENDHDCGIIHYK